LVVDETHVGHQDDAVAASSVIQFFLGFEICFGPRKAKCRANKTVYLM